jgi:non-specific serine/threonine protein kinase
MGVHQRLPFVVYARSNGPTLAERLDPRGQVTTDVGRWAGQVLEGLAFAHDTGLAHRDLQLPQCSSATATRCRGRCCA